MTKMLGKCLWLALVLVAFSAVQAQVRSDVATDRGDLQADRQAIIAANLPMTEEQAKLFWPMFREYRGEMAAIGDRLEELIFGYAKNFDTLTDEQAAKMLDDLLAVQHDDVKIRTKWAPKFGKVLPPKTLTRFYQLENKLDAALRFEAAAQIPLVETATE